MKYLPEPVSGGPLARQKQEARRLGWHALRAGALTLGGVSLCLFGMGGGLGWFLGGLGALTGTAWTGVQTWKWLQFRGKWGLRF